MLYLLHCATARNTALAAALLRWLQAVLFTCCHGKPSAERELFTIRIEPTFKRFDVTVSQI